MEPLSPVIMKVVGVSKRFGEKRVLENINFDIMSGEIFGLIGMSGMGKTTMLETMIGFIEPDEGDVLFRPEPLLTKDEASSYRSVLQEQKDVRQSFGFASQNPSFYMNLTVEENLEYFGSLYNISKDILKTNIETSLKLVGLYDDRKSLAGNLSGGMQKRLDLACALVHNPKILILDEPTADLDIVIRTQIWNLIRKINARGTTIVIASHWLHEMEMLCHRIALLHDKRIIAMGTSDQIKSAYSKNEEIRVKSSPGNYRDIAEMIRRRAGANIRSITMHHDYLAIYTPEPLDVIPDVVTILNQMREKVIHMDIAKPKLEEVFESMTKVKLG